MLYFISCTKTLDSGKCRLGDVRYTFIGRVGIITRLDNTQVIPQAWVSFNNGRTSYQFSQEDLTLDVRTRSSYGNDYFIIDWLIITIIIIAIIIIVIMLSCRDVVGSEI